MEKYNWVNDELLSEIASDKNIKIVCSYIQKPSSIEYGSDVSELDIKTELKDHLKSLGITRLYRFQEEALRTIKSGKNTIIVSGTGTGKTEAFLIPILDDVLERPFVGVQAILVYPTKALSRDQIARIERLSGGIFGLRYAVLDGDTPANIRQRIFMYPPSILITNPDMINYSLVYSDEFKSMITNVKYIVLDDVHVYNGIFGSHVSFILRRLLRFIREKPVIIGSSATIGNPREFFEKLIGDKAVLVKGIEGKRGETIHTFIRPLERSKLSETIRLIRYMQKRDLKTLVFADSHRIVEMIKRLADKYGIEVAVHRSGLKPEVRRKIEVGFKRGSIKTVVATPTLELGIDIGDLDVVILYSIPPNCTRYSQRIGRCGRRGQRSYVFTILGDDPISAYYEAHPEDFFMQNYEQSYIDTRNEEVAKIQLLAMCLDAPLKISRLAGYEREIIVKLIEEGYLRLSKSGIARATIKGRRYLRGRMNIRGIGDMVWIYTENGVKIGFREKSMAIKELHPGAIYLHGGNIYISLRFEGNKVVVRRLPEDVNLITTALYYTFPEIIKILKSKKIHEVKLVHAVLKIKDVVYAYVVKLFPGGEKVREVFLKNPLEYEFTTKGLLMVFPTNPEWNEIQNAEAFHAIEHAFIASGETLIGAAPRDLGGVSFPTGHIFVYDSYPGGSGASAMLFKYFDKTLKRAYKIISDCKCIDGCPKCIFSPYCGNNNRILSRKKAKVILENVLLNRVKDMEFYEEPEGKPIV